MQSEYELLKALDELIFQSKSVKSIFYRDKLISKINEFIKDVGLHENQHTFIDFEKIKEVIRYDLIGASKEGVTDHPQKYVAGLGFKVLAFEGVPIADCVFMEVEGHIQELPKFIQYSNHKLTSI